MWLHLNCTDDTTVFGGYSCLCATNLVLDCKGLFPWQSWERCEEGKTSWSDQRGSWSLARGYLYSATPETWPGRHTKTNKLCVTKTALYKQNSVAQRGAPLCYGRIISVTACVFVTAARRGCTTTELLRINKSLNMYLKEVSDTGTDTVSTSSIPPICQALVTLVMHRNISAV